jgi:type VI secretion system protein ImpK
MATTSSSLATGAAPGRQLDNLALAFQEVLTAIVRLRANSQNITDAETFRAQVRAALKQAEQDSTQRLGYLPEDVKLATFAVVAFLDESILNSRNPVFVDWPRKPLQEELFGVHVAGEIFFRNVERLLTRNDSHQLADVLEVHLLCILLGFRGRYSLGGSGELRTSTEQLREKIRRIRGYNPELSPAWAPPAEAPRRAVDPWVRRLLMMSIGLIGLAVVLFVVFKIMLGSTVSSVEALAAPVRL